MLSEIRETVELRADFEHEGTLVAQFSSRINENGISNGVSPSIRDYDLHQELRNEVRQAQREFEDKVWEVEDRLASNGGNE